MKVIVIGAGPTRLTLGATLAKRGHEVVAIDRDGGPAADGSWHRIGVMQFHHAHGFRAQVPKLLQDEWPDASDAWVELGGEQIVIGLPDDTTTIGMRSRRITYERALRSAARLVPGFTTAVGSVGRLIEHDGSVSGVVVDGRSVVADLVVDASGRGLASNAGLHEIGGDCGISYVGRIYRRHPNAEPGPLPNPIAWGGTFDGYQAIVFPHEDRHLSAVIVRPTSDDTLRQLRHVHAFEAAARAIPGMNEWTHPERSSPPRP